MNKNKETILIHLPSYRDPELIPTIKDALANAKYPKECTSVSVDNIVKQTNLTILMNTEKILDFT